jgi:hypothetical protein
MMSTVTRKDLSMSAQKVIFLSLTLIVFVTIFTACAVASTSTTGGQSAGETGGSSSLPLASQLLLGTFKLEGSADAVDATTAIALIPLWQIEKELSTNSAAAQVEKDTVTELIQSTMTPKQLQAITAMKLTQNDLQTFLDQFGQTGKTTTTSASNMTSSSTAGGPPGVGPDGGAGPGGDMLSASGTGASTTTNAQQLATSQAVRAQSGTSTSLTSSLLDAIISLLQKRAGMLETPSAA